jgi:hypothetical protein
MFSASHCGERMRDKVWAAFGNLNVHVILLYYFLFSFVLRCSPLLLAPQLGRNLIQHRKQKKHEVILWEAPAAP